jgi:choline monooxygenase
MNPLLSAARLAPQGLAHALALPAPYYTDPTMPAIDAQAIFARSWQLVGHANRLPDAGDHLVTDIAGLPIVVIRDTNGRLRAYHNVCRHRAGPLALCDGKGAKALRCKYHGWTYTLDGVLRSAPEMQDAQDFELSSIRLPELRVDTWHGLVFVGGDGAIPFSEFSHGLDGPLRSLSPESFVFHQRFSYEVACNWKVYCDNYLEGYHVPHIHPGLNSLLDYRQYVTETGDWFSYQYSPLVSDASLYGDGDALYYFIYPNTMLNLLPGRLQTNRVLPLGVDRCIVEFDYYYAADDSAAAMARRQADHDFAHQVQDEDIAICEHVQRGLASGSYVAGRLNPLRENAVHHYHELVRQAYRDAAG